MILPYLGSSNSGMSHITCSKYLIFHSCFAFYHRQTVPHSSAQKLRTRNVNDGVCLAQWLAAGRRPAQCPDLPHDLSSCQLLRRTHRAQLRAAIPGQTLGLGRSNAATFGLAASPVPLNGGSTDRARRRPMTQFAREMSLLSALYAEKRYMWSMLVR